VAKLPVAIKRSYSHPLKALPDGDLRGLTILSPIKIFLYRIFCNVIDHGLPESLIE